MATLRRLLLPILMMLSILGINAQTLAPVVVTSQIYQGTTIVKGTAQPNTGIYTDATMAICVEPIGSIAPSCAAGLASVNGGAHTFTPMASGLFSVTLDVPIPAGHEVYVLERVNFSGQVITTRSPIQQLIHPPDRSPECIPNALSGYSAPGTKQSVCTIHLDRNNFATPTTITVPKGTVVSIELDHAHWNETIQFKPTTTAIADQDIAGAVLKQLLLSNLQALAASIRNNGVSIASATADKIQTDEQTVQDHLEAALLKVSNANTMLNCFESYRAVADTNGQQASRCLLTILVGPIVGPNEINTFTQAKTTLITALGDATNKVSLDATLRTAITAEIKQRLLDCAAVTSPPRPAVVSLCDPDTIDSYQTRLDALNNTAAAIEKLQQNFLADIDTLNSWGGVLDDAGNPTNVVVSQFTQSRSRTSMITIAATEIISSTTSTLGSITINWQTQPFVLSSGVMLSEMPNRSYAISQLIVDGAPVPDPTNPGKYLTYVDETVTHPSISFPMVFGNYRIGSLSRFDWENRCPNHCAILLTGGMGYNLIQHTADFAGGVSFQIGSVLLTPSAHVGRENLLTNGLYPGEILGSNPPSALTTEDAWTVHFGLALTLAIPIP